MSGSLTRVEHEAEELSGEKIERVWKILPDREGRIELRDPSFQSLGFRVEISCSKHRESDSLSRCYQHKPEEQLRT